MEPLNLVKRKNRPVAVVAPSSVVSPPAATAVTTPVFPSSLLSSLYMNSVLNDQLFQRAAAAAQYGAPSSFWTPANRFWQVMHQQHNSAAQQYAAAASAAAAAAAVTAATASPDKDDDKRMSVSPPATTATAATSADPTTNSSTRSVGLKV